jgi:hypothetical protein
MNVMIKYQMKKIKAMWCAFTSSLRPRHPRAVGRVKFTKNVGNTTKIENFNENYDINYSNQLTELSTKLNEKISILNRIIEQSSHSTNEFRDSILATSTPEKNITDGVVLIKYLCSISCDMLE